MHDNVGVPRLRRPMKDDDFWQLIGRLDGGTHQAALADLTDALRSAGPRRARAFQETLARHLYELDREELFVQPVRFVGEPPENDPIPLSDDTFLYLRAGLIARGRATYQAVLTDPAALAHGQWEESEDLLYAAEEAVGKEIETEYPTYTGANKAHWSPRPEPPAGSYRRRLACVLLHDLATAHETITYSAKRGEETRTEYWGPDYVPERVWSGLTEEADMLLAMHDGLPDSFAAEQFAVVIEFGDDWRLDPLIEAPSRLWFSDEYLQRRIRLRVPTEASRAWDPTEVRAALRALMARGLLAALPADHDARPALERIRAAGNALLPE